MVIILAHLYTVEKIIIYFTEMDKMNYRRMFSVYLSDMRALEEKQPNHVPRTAKGVYYAGEQ